MDEQTKRVKIQQMKAINHYHYLEKHLPEFLAKLGIDFNTMPGIISAHGDKAYGYRTIFEESGIPFEKGVAIYLLTYIKPFSEECRQTKNGWVPPDQWVIRNKDRFLKYLP